jgi:hypothetical protein
VAGQSIWQGPGSWQAGHLTHLKRLGWEPLQLHDDLFKPRRRWPHAQCVVLEPTNRPKGCSRA